MAHHHPHHLHHQQDHHQYPPPPPQPQPPFPHPHYHPQPYPNPNPNPNPHPYPHPPPPPPHHYPDPYSHHYEPGPGPIPHYDYPPPIPPHHYDYPPPVPHYPHYPPPHPNYQHAPDHSNPRPYKGHRTKRAREAGDSQVQPTKKQAIGNDILFRVVVPSPQIGKVIGKAGHRVQKVRDDTKATIKIADPLARFEERVIIINSKEKSDGGMTDAEKALLQIAALILVDDGSTAQPSSVSAPAASTDPNASAAGAAHASPNAVKLLIAGSQAGSLIGVSGQNIEKLRNSSGAAIAVLAANQLPMCASAHESDRLVQISGDSAAVLKAVEEIGAELRANPPKQVISISPTYNLSITRAAQSHMDPNAAECVTLDMVISETMIGGLIGKSGSNIGRIRSESGAMIKVFGGKGEQKHRQIQLIGTAPQVALAKQRVDEYVYTQLTQSGEE